MALTETSIFQAARDILGNIEENALAEIYVPIQAIRPAFKSVIQRLNRLYGSSDAKRETLFETVAEQQDYDLESWVGDDVLKIESVTRSGAFLGESLSNGSFETGVDAEVVIPQGFQQSAMDEILAQERYRRTRKFNWEVTNIDGTKYLRLMPFPTSIEYVEVIYISTGMSIETLPDQCETALVYGACVAICDAQINRINSQKRLVTGAMNPADGENSLQRLRALQSQRDRYIDLYDEAMVNLGGT